MAATERSRIYCAGPSITEREIAYVTDAVTNCWYADAGVYHDRLEQTVADYLGVKHVHSTPTGTSAIHLALWALGIGPGDEVIVPELTWIGSSAPISYLGATPVFADVDTEHWCLAPESLEANITSRTKAVVVVDLYGNVPDMERIRDICQRHGVAIVEDAAQAFGSSWQGQKAGTWGDVGIFSLHGSKTVTSGEGGLLVTDRDDLYQRAASLRDHGRRLDGSRFYGEFDRYYYHFELGSKFKMSSMQAALALAQIERADELVARKREIHGWYREHLDELPLFELHVERPGLFNSYWLPAVTIRSERPFDKLRVMQEFEHRNIDIRPLYYPLSSMPPYCDIPSGVRAQQANTVAYRESPYGFNLPSNMQMTRSDVARVSGPLSRLNEQAGVVPTSS